MVGFGNYPKSCPNFIVLIVLLCYNIDESKEMIHVGLFFLCIFLTKSPRILPPLSEAKAGVVHRG